jgi:NAD(P)-dependent dehydrogenase (short-subunit alcohol dehydrogenase family)
MEWRNQVAVVTGGSRGIGRATARFLAQRGAAVCVNYAMHPDVAEALVAEITTAGGRAIAVTADVADSTAVEAMVAHRGGTGPGNHLGEQRRRELAGRPGARSRACAKSTWTA